MSKKVTKKIGRHMITMIDPGVEWTLDMEERSVSPSTGRMSLKAYCEELFQNVVISPKGLTIADFDHEDELVDLVRTFKSFRRTQSSSGAQKPASQEEAHQATEASDL